MGSRLSPALGAIAPPTPTSGVLSRARPRAEFAGQMSSSIAHHHHNSFVLLRGTEAKAWGGLS